MKQIPNLFTLLNLVFGCLAIIFILQTGETMITQIEGTWVPRLPEKITWGALLIGAAAIVDFLDGFVARLFKATSPMGEQLDSLADVVSFGVAPGLILYQLLRISYMQEEAALDISIWALIPALLFPCAGAWRLARFNLDKNPATDFKGVPIPAAGLVVASLPLILFYDQLGLAQVFMNPWILYAIILLLSFLMISKNRFMALKGGSGSASKKMPLSILLVVAVLAAVFLQWLAIPVIFIVYIILSLTTKKQPE